MSTLDETIVLLHGIGRTRWSMRRMEIALRNVRYRTLNISYPSRRGDLGSLAQFIDRRLAQADIWITSERVHFVTHSMGGLVAARYLHDFSDRIPAGKVGRVVMLAPPSKGSELADFLSVRSESC